MEETGNDSAIKNMIGKILIFRGAGHVTWKVTIVRSFILPETVVPFVSSQTFSAKRSTYPWGRHRFPLEKGDLDHLHRASHLRPALNQMTATLTSALPT